MQSQYTTLVDENAWHLQIPRPFLFAEECPVVAERVSQLQRFEPSPFLVPFSRVTVSPRYLHVWAEEVTAAAVVGLRRDYDAVSSGLSEAQVQPILSDVVVGIAALHSRHIVHGCLQLSSLLQHRASGRVVLVDHPFPVRLFVPNGSLGVAARVLAAPEIRASEPYDAAADVWSIGALLVQLSSPNGQSLDTEDLVDTDLLSPFLTSLSVTAKGVALQCLKRDPARRPQLVELLEHPFLHQRRQSMATTSSPDVDEEASASTSEADENTDASATDSEGSGEVDEEGSETDSSAADVGTN